MTRHHESIHKGLWEMLIGQEFTVYLIDEYCTSKFCPACESRIEKLHKIYDPCLKNPKHKYHVAMVAASNFVATAATAVSVAIKTATDAASIIDCAQQGRDQCMPIRPQSADIIQWIGEEKGWFEDKIRWKSNQQLRDGLTERNRKQHINIQPADNLRHIVRLSGWSQGKIERKIRQRIRDELAAQRQNGQHQQEADNRNKF
ncbi:hypothetical protein GGF37_001545 [Kickxella alabastrina]|nr:hypothetical protein GGF37_001545 [Kickxella alabastrina]